MVTIGKAVAGGVPMGAYGVTAELGEQLDVARNVASLSAEDAARITHRNAAELLRHPLPDSSWLAC